ncbi:MAG: type III-A CRISPR-associated RAMP protein Csm5 [Methylobacter sp.]|nr:type III-A CRISPR-associated RAMP protein Csm5 [Methylobacter sp.]
MKMQGKTISVHLGVEVLTPLQCGSGEDLFKESDYVEKDKGVFVVDQVRSFNEVASGDHDKDTLLACGNQLSDLVKLAGEHYGYALPILSGGFAKMPDKIRAHLKDALFQPYIPGSALKGAISTALIAEHLRSTPDNYQSFLPKKNAKTNKPTAPQKVAAKKLLDELLGQDPKQNIFRALHVKDAMFKPEQLRLVDIRWLNLTSRADKVEALWRSLSSRKNCPKWQDADGIYAEMLVPKSTASFQLQWDEFLLSDMQWSTAKKDFLPSNFEDLKGKLNHHASYRLQQEIAFYHRYGAVKPEQECTKLLNDLNQDSDSIYIQLSWGSGWRGMTGDWMSTDLALEMRALYNLGKTNMPFPKTRRLAVLGEPKFPLGWVRLFPYSQIEQKIKQQQAEQAAHKQREIDEKQRIESLSPLGKELENLKSVPEQEWDTRLLHKLDEAQLSKADRKQIAEKIKQLMIKADKWQPDFAGSNKSKLKFKERSLKVLKFLSEL